MITMLFLLACAGNGPGDSGSGNDDTSVTTSFSAKLEITLPAGESVAETEVRVDGEAVPSCDATSHKCSYDVEEPDTYTVTADCEATYFAPLTITVTEEDNGSTLSNAWTTGGCGDANWQVGDGFCQDDTGKSLWTNGQVACDFSGRWQGIEDEYWDWDATLSMTAIDLDGDGIASEVGIEGSTPFDGIVNASGTKFYEVTDAGALISGELVKINGDEYVPATSCADFDAVWISLIGANGVATDWHIRPY
ncbi:MAG: hypothetical protein EBT21_00610 [Actinobacteria bacterium]|nr:hypothetical protein [Actinomycetota bacterium]